MNTSSFLANSGAESSYLRDRVIILILFFLILFLSIVARLFYLGTQDLNPRVSYDTTIREIPRPRIVDRNGAVIAMNIPIISIFAEPNRIIDSDEVYESLVTVFPDLDFKATIKKLNSDSKFAWLRRKVVPSQQQAVLSLGLPGIGFRAATMRIYPSANSTSHVLGYTDIDNKGIAGFEKYLDDAKLINEDAKPVELSIDLRVQHQVRQALEEARIRYQAKGALGIVLDANTGEIVSLSSVPDYNPVGLSGSPSFEQTNRATAGVYEMGSVFKAFTAAMALESGTINMESEFDASHPIRIGGHEISDFHAQNRVLSFREAFIHSSNISMAKMAKQVGEEYQKDFLKRLGLLDRIQNFELPEIAKPLVPTTWRPSNHATISYGHGIATTPLQTAAAIASILNGGKLLKPTLLARTQSKADEQAVQVISPETSVAMRYLFWLNSKEGSGRRADVKGFLVGGKTGTSEKIKEGGGYDPDRRFNTFVSAFPIHDPKYVVLVSLDEPQIEEGEEYATAGYNAAPLSSQIIQRIAPILGLSPNFNFDIESQFSDFIESDKHNNIIGQIGSLNNAIE